MAFGHGHNGSHCLLTPDPQAFPRHYQTGEHQLPLPGPASITHSTAADGHRDRAAETFGCERAEIPLKMSVQVRTLGRKSHRLDALVAKEVAKRLAEPGVAIHEQITFSVEEAVFEVRQIPRNLPHPGFVRMDRCASEVNAARLQLNDKQQVERHQTTLRPDFNSREVDGREDIPVRFEERLSCGLSVPVRCGLDAVCFQNVSDGLIRDVVAKILDCSGNPIESPAGVLASHPYGQLPDFV